MRNRRTSYTKLTGLIAKNFDPGDLMIQATFFERNHEGTERKITAGSKSDAQIQAISMYITQSGARQRRCGGGTPCTTRKAGRGTSRTAEGGSGVWQASAERDSTWVVTCCGLAVGCLISIGHCLLSMLATSSPWTSPTVGPNKAS